MNEILETMARPSSFVEHPHAKNSRRPEVKQPPSKNSELRIGNFAEYTSKWESEILLVDDKGDIVLQCPEPAGASSARVPWTFRVSSAMLQKASGYFAAMLAPGKFSEGASVQSATKAVEERLSMNISQAPAAQLPIVSFPDVEQLTFSLNTLRAVKTFVLLAHGMFDFLEKQNVSILAHLTVIADQILAIETVRPYADNYLKKLNFDAFDSNRKEVTKWRQLVYLAYVYDKPDLFSHFSAALIEHGLTNETEAPTAVQDALKNSRSTTIDDSMEIDDSDPVETEKSKPWTWIPEDIEEELHTRRACILSTLASLPRSLLRPYLSNPRVLPNCKLGYDESPQCDSFQLGEALRFLFRKRLISSNMQASFDPRNSSSVPQEHGGGGAPPTPYSGRLTSLVKALKELPESQLNRHHPHCGIRKSLINRLSDLDLYFDRVSPAPWFGLCLLCWSPHEPGSSWARERHGGTWRGNVRSNRQEATKFDRSQNRSGSKSHLRNCPSTSLHKLCHAVFTADEWDWADEEPERKTEKENEKEKAGERARRRTTVPTPFEFDRRRSHEWPHDPVLRVDELDLRRRPSRTSWNAVHLARR